MTNSNVQKLTTELSRHTVRMMAQSPHGGIVAERRADDFLVVNVNEVIDGVPTGCATLVFQGDLPTPAELRNGDLVIEGTFAWHVKFGSRFDVDAFVAVERTPVKPDSVEPVVRKTRRLSVIPEAPTKPVEVTKPVKRPQRRTTPSKDAISTTNDWYSKSGGKGDSLDFMDA